MILTLSNIKIIFHFRYYRSYSILSVDGFARSFNFPHTELVLQELQHITRRSTCPARRGGARETSRTRHRRLAKHRQPPRNAITKVRCSLSALLPLPAPS